ncbi:RidA family protein, partial [Myroides odoratimimus]|uniref:RidA family protein n=2 Tax=Flavobacteriaceae TaxID=49546 RepID=UPI002DB6A0D7
MIKTTINPWQWQFERNYAQAIEVKNAQSTLYCSGQVAIDQNGISSNADMKTQLLLCIENLEKV